MSLIIRPIERSFGPSLNSTRSTPTIESAEPDISMIGVPGFPTIAVILAVGNRCRSASNAGKLKTTSPSWPKLMTKIFRGANDTERQYRRNRTRIYWSLVIFHLSFAIFPEWALQEKVGHRVLA